MDFNTFINQELERINQSNLYRSLQTLDFPTQRWVQINNDKYLNLCSNNYLGYAGKSEMAEAAIRAVEVYGTGSTGSRLITGTSPLHEKLETLVAEFKGTQKALVYSCGYVANVSTIATLMHPGDLILSDELNHASIIDGVRLSKAEKIIYKHNDINDLLNKLIKNRYKYNKCLLVTDTIFSMDGDRANLRAIVDLKEKYQFAIMVDEAHATGILGDKGEGLATQLGLSSQIDIHMGTFSKAIGVEGAYIAGDNALIDYLINTSRGFIFSTAPSPAVIGAVIQAIKLVQADTEARTRLWKNIYLFKTSLKNLLKNTSLTLIENDSPIFCLETTSIKQAIDLQEYLFNNHNIFVKAIRPPTVATARIRLCLSSRLTKQELEMILNALYTFVKVSEEIKS